MATQRHNMGLGRATGVGVGAIVGGGILVLSGVAMATTGPSVILVFALNGLIAFLTAISFAEMSSSFPESGGTYTFAKKVMSVRTAFLVGWIVWFASIVAGVLYVISFAQIALVIIDTGWRALGGLPPPWLNERYAVTGIAITVTSLYTLSLCRRGSGGAQWSNIIKVVVFRYSHWWWDLGDTATGLANDQRPNATIFFRRCRRFSSSDGLYIYRLSGV